MQPPATLETPRLRLRPWLPRDHAPWAALNADPRVMEFFPAVRTPEESAASLARIEAHFNAHGFGLWAAELKSDAKLAGMIGLAHVPFQAHFTPAVEIGWRLRHDLWNQGLATEGASSALEFAFATLRLEEVVSFTAEQNTRSRRVMEKLNLTHDPAEDFHHPLLPPEHWLARHVLYRRRRDNRTSPQLQSSGHF